MMPELLHTIADRHTLFLTDLGNAIEDETQVIVALPESKQGPRALDAARTSLGEALGISETTKGLIVEMEERLKRGVNGDTFRLIARAGDLLIRSCLMIIERVDQLWNQAEVLGGEPDEVKNARVKISTARQHFLTLNPQIAQWRKLAERRPPEIDLGRLERGAAQIRQGRFKTGEQILEEIRKRNS